MAKTNIDKILKKEREKRGLLISQVAREIGCAEETLRRIERGKGCHKKTAELIEKWAQQKVTKTTSKADTPIARSPFQNEVQIDDGGDLNHIGPSSAFDNFNNQLQKLKEEDIQKNAAIHKARHALAAAIKSHEEAIGKIKSALATIDVFIGK